MSELEKNEGIKILKNNYLGHLAFVSKDRPYVVPITYYYNATKNTVICYAVEGHKINAMRKHNNVSLVVEEVESVNNWKSVLVVGVFEELHGVDAKYFLHQFAIGVRKVIRKKEKRDLHFISEFSIELASVGIPIVYQINILEIIGKQRVPNAINKS
ncbi:pyridoxamine 5'-phosphate oxidase family protein [Nonlabens sp.]|uniref:pyridoxamine 5'-phosphate oxidase family protein n=1 Tax=Nonlabens sp. TaxID=1888209 RepID=UPI001BCEF795|nr:pyridoxamine 5'-phosphate oxidase family protein [Nonlabens sp.]